MPGDTLWGISQHFYGNGYDWPALCQANRELITDCNLIYPGQRLTIPVHLAHGPVFTRARNPVIVSTPKYELAGTLSCSGLEMLWDTNGGNPQAAYLAAEIAMAESDGNQYAVSPTDDIGYWQINYPSWGPGLATTNPDGNARAAIEISANGTNWEPWTTYREGLYEGRC
jgi:hypothetical protein